ncbi:phage tail tape measure protein [Sphingomonas sp. PB2P12]|uniref:phage tail tape measure protein n=1 Tax=Sphingomonas sandaracina TaxID=3096157 RepID=UPI002FC9E595
MNMAVVGAARVVFGADTSDFDAGAKGVEGVLGRLVEKFQAVEQRIKNIGLGVTVGITVPFAAMVRAVDKGAGSFEGQMKKVEAALGNISGDQLKALSDQARTLGPQVGKGATEAAGAIEALGLAGVSTSDILGGALKAALDLSAAGMVDASASSALVTDIMGQFKVTAGELPGVVQKVVGALDTSKFGFDDFRLAVGQGGAIAAASGVSFMDFATAISATSTQFTSGADAGTSFKTYIQTLTGKSKEAESAMKKLGLSFFDANGELKPLSEQADVLRKAYGNLTDEAKSKGLEKVFGADAARTAIGLMEQGREGFEKLQSEIAGGDVEAKIAKRLEGSEAASKRIAVAWESLKIAFGIEGGLLSPLTALKNGYASLLETISNAPPWMLKIGAAFSAMSAAIGPLLLVVGHLGAIFLANFAASKFGLIGRALGLLISPVSTIIGLLGEYGLTRVLTMIAGRFAAFLGPVGWAIGAFLLFKDTIMIVLGQVWDKMVATLGPPLEAIMAKLSGIFGALSGGPIGSAFGFLVDVISGLADVIGTVLGGVLAMFGEVLVHVMAAGVQAIEGFVDVLAAFVDGVSALLSGDFAGAWEASGRMIEAVFGTIVDMIVAFVPDIEVPMRLAYEAAKAWLSDGFSSVMAWFGEAVQSGVNYVTNAFPNVVASAKSVYEGVKAWLVDKFGGLMTWIGNAAKWIGDKYAAMKERLGFGAAAPDKAPPLPEKPKETAPPPKPKRSVDFGGDEKTKKTKKAPKGRDTSRDQENRDQLEFQVQIDAARLRGDLAAEEALRRKMDLSKQIEAYQRTGLSLAAATAAATRDMATLDAARRDGLAQDLARDELSHQIQLASIAGNRTLEESLERQQEVRDRILGFQRDGLSLVDATIRAQKQQAEIDATRATVRAQLLADDAQDRELKLAQARGDSDERIRQLEREIAVRQRERELQREQGLSPEAAHAQAMTEAMQDEQARQQGIFRDTIKGGFQAALDGDLKGWIKNWWKDRVAKGLEEALNSLSDAIAKLFSKAGDGTSGSGGGFMGAIGSILGSVFGKGTGAGTIGPVDMSGWGGAGGPMSVADPGLKLPGFKTGGSFRIGGQAGIDKNLVMFRGSVGEHVNISKANDNGPVGTTVVHMPITYTGAVDIADKAYVQANAQQTKSQVMSAVTEANRRRAGGK